MFGDPKQRAYLPFIQSQTNTSPLSSVPPHGRDTVPALKTIFDLHHLQEQSYFLDTQCTCRLMDMDIYLSSLDACHILRSHARPVGPLHIAGGVRLEVAFGT